MSETYSKEKKLKEVFIFVAGATPQIITETIYALAASKYPVFPDEIIVITTVYGKQQIEESLFKKDILKKLADEYNIPAIPLNDQSFVIIKDEKGSLLNDITNSNDNEALGDIICSVVKDKASDKTSRLHCSLAGGRKTMSFYLGSALQLFGRSWDKLYHVLVTPEFESNPDFFYKPVKNTTIKCRLPDGSTKALNTKDAEVYLAELPFIRLGSKLHLNGKGFRELVSEGQKEIDIATMQPEVKVNLASSTIQIGEKTIRLSPMHLMIYTAYLRRKHYHCKYGKRIYCHDCTDCFPSLLELTTRPALEEMAKDYMITAPAKVDDLLYKYKSGLSLEAIRQAVSKIKKVICLALNDEVLASYYSVATSQRTYHKNSKHGIKVEKQKIRIE